MKNEKIKKIVRKNYARMAKKESCCCEADFAKKIGYSEEELTSVPEGAFSLGCGNPVAMTSLKEGETVLDLGSGAGFDCFIAAAKVGEKGRVIGVDMTPEMISKARENARKGKYENVEFRLGEIENLPVADLSIDVVISNCVINLAQNKKRVFEEAFRALRPGGRLMVSDIVLLKELPDTLRKSEKAYVGCVSGAIMKDRYIEVIKEAGFRDIEVVEESRFPVEWLVDLDPKSSLKELNMTVEDITETASSVASIKVYGTKPESDAKIGHSQGNPASHACQN